MKYMKGGNFVLLVLAFIFGPLRADEPFVVSGGISPDKKLAVVVNDNTDWNAPDYENAKAGTVYLFDYSKKRIIEALEKVDGTGGGFGHTQSNVSADWNSDSRFVIINFRGGRQNHGFVVYKISTYFRSTTSSSGVGLPHYRAIPQILPSELTGPNADKVFANVTTTSNFGKGASWQDVTHSAIVLYGFRPQNGDNASSDIINAQGEIEVVYAYANDKWTIEKFNQLPDNY